MRKHGEIIQDRGRGQRERELATALDVAGSMWSSDGIPICENTEKSYKSARGRGRARRENCNKSVKGRLTREHLGSGRRIENNPNKSGRLQEDYACSSVGRCVLAE
ncbi:hypothetical protein J6590_013390 [Homalodisca vitripennis]|nr:hypothetical protein J6590_013390 [Homalodisca vitripennis]